MRTLTLDDLLGFNAAVSEEYGQQSVVINENNLQSALSNQSSYYETDEQAACAVFRSIIIGHGFQDGNKRTAVLAIHYMLPPTVDVNTVADVAISCAKGELKEVGDIVALLYS